VTLENNANEEVIIEYLLKSNWQDLAKEKISFYDYLLNLKITKVEPQRTYELFKQLIKKFY
jgi:hypothetical protein